MTQVFDEKGQVHPATVLSATPNTVTQIKTAEKDGYSAVQLGFGTKKEKHVKKPQATKGAFAHFAEYRPKDGAAVSVEQGAVISVDQAFSVGDKVIVSGISKAKGFQGVVKRHGFAGGQRTHGQAHNERSPGSIGGGLRRRVPKGMRMAGRMGGRIVTVKNLTIVGVNKEKNQLIVEGAIPGRKGTVVEVRGM
jgi:large subunit ribosomal protein L3